MASNPRLVASLADACAAAAATARGRQLVERVLAHALEGCDAERAFVIRAPAESDAEPVVEAFGLAGRVRQARPSSTVARSALDRAEPFVSLDPLRERAFVSGRSVRALGLRWVLGAPLGQDRGRALLLDSRRTAPTASRTAELLQAARAFGALLALGTHPPPRPDASRTPATLVACSQAMEHMLAWIERVARTDLPVLIRGESGCGKEVVARTIHERSPRSGGPFIAVSCTELPESLIEAELFGSERGAYTGAERDRPGLFRSAEGGTLFLDEIGDMPLALQAKLLRALQERTVRPVGAAAEVAVDARLLTATHRDLARGLRAGTFREDLFYRLTVTEIAVPPLRERREDLPLLVADLGLRLAAETGVGRFEISAEALELLRGHRWPGNVRELRSVLARALLRTAGGPVLPEHLHELGPRPPGSECATNLELQMIREALERAEGSLTGAARRIGWSRSKLYRRMRALAMR
jgi:DNA-binding NtrC family response regulator